MSEYTSPVPVDHPRFMFHFYLYLIMVMWLVMTVSIVVMWPLAGYIVAVINVTVGLLTRNRVWEMKDRMEEYEGHY